jgi:1,4-alpha-glucan branching enzyme
MSFAIDTSDDKNAAVTFTLAANDHTEPVSVVGSFNDWTPRANELLPDGAGMISTTVGVPYEQDVYFRYLSDNDGWFDDPDAEPAGSGSRIEPISRSHTTTQPSTPKPSVIDLNEQASTPAPAGPKAG